MLKKLTLTLILIGSCLQASDIKLAVSLNAGKYSDINVYRLGLQKDFESTVYSFDNFDIKGYHELSINKWHGKYNDINAIAYSPVFTINFNKFANSNYKPYIDFGVGVAYLSGKQIDHIDMSSRFQFEDRISVGVKKDNIDAYIRYMHYSNGGIKEPNHGIDLTMIGMNYRF